MGQDWVEGEIVPNDDQLAEWRQEIALMDRGAARAPVARVRMVEMDIYDPEVARDIARGIQG